MFLKNIFIVHSLRFAQILSICSAKIFHVASPEIFFSFFFSEKSIFSSFY